MPSDMEQGAIAGIEPQTQASGTESDIRASPDARATENAEHAGEAVGTSDGSPSGGGSRERHQDYPFTRDVCNVVLLGLLASFICIFTWAWVDAFQKANYDQAVGLMLILFFGTIVCTCGFRRRVAALSQLEEERTQAQMDQVDQVGEVMQGPKGVPLHIRKNFHYFIFEESATTNEDMKESPPTPLTISSFPAGASGKARGQGADGPPGTTVSTLHDGEGGVSDSSPVTTHASAAASTAAVDENGGDNGGPTTESEDDRTEVEGAPSAREASYAHRGGISGREGASADSGDDRFSANREEDSSDREGASTDHDGVSTSSAASHDSRSRDGPEAEVEPEAGASASANGTYETVLVVDEWEGGQGASRETSGHWQWRQQDVGGEEARPRRAEEPYQAQETPQAEPRPSHRSEQEDQAIPTFAWASTTLTDCSVCLEAYKAGDRVCRLPCAHAFHAACIDTWLDQQHVCPQCRFNLLPGRRPVMPPARPDDIMPGDESSMSSLFSSPVDGMSTLPVHGASASGLTGPYLTFPDTPQAGSLSPMTSTAAMQSFRRSPGFTPRASGRMRGTPVSSSNATIGTPGFSVFSSAASALVLPGAETPSTDGPPRSINASYGSAFSRPRPATPRHPGGHQHQPHLQPSLRLQQLQRQQIYDAQQEIIHGQISGQTPRHHAVPVGQLHSQLQGQQHPHQPRQRQVNPPQHTRHGALSSSSVVSSIPGYAISTSGGVIGGGLVNGTNASLGSHPANAIVNGNGGSGQNFNILSNGSIGLNVGSGQGQRRLRLPSLGRRPRSGSCDIITSPGLCMIGSSGSSSPKTGRGSERIAALSSRGNPSFRGGGQFKGFPALQLRMRSWDEGDDFAGSVESSESCLRSRRGSDDWGTRDWGRGLRSSAAVGRARTESAADRQLGDGGEGPPAVVRVLPRGSPLSLEEGDDHELRFVEEDVESLSTMSATASEHEFFARTMLYC